MPELLANCERCSREYNQTKLSECPGCGYSNQITREDVQPASEDPLHKLLKQQIAASNRTTHAIRALIRYGFAFFYFAVYLGAKAALDLSDLWSLLLVVATAVIAIWTIIKAHREFDASARDLDLVIKQIRY